MKTHITNLLRDKELFSNIQSYDSDYCSALEIISILEDMGYSARLAGGCVRDLLLSYHPKDYDVATTATPEEVTAAFSSKGSCDIEWNVVPTGWEHGTVTVVSKGLYNTAVEVTTLRKDVATDGRRATVEFASLFEEDAERRDFTLNAMYLDREGYVYDYFGGVRDLRRRRLRFVGPTIRTGRCGPAKPFGFHSDADQRIKEDYLRILRCYRFASKYGFSIDSEAYEAITRNRQELQQISQERLTSEFLQILGGRFAETAIAQMKNKDIIDQLLPGISWVDRSYTGPLVYDNLNVDVKTRGLVRLASHISLFTASAGDFDVILKDTLKLSCEQAAILYTLFEGPQKIKKVKTTADALNFIDWVEGKVANDLVFSVCFPYWRSIGEYFEVDNQLDFIEDCEVEYGPRRHKMPISGNDLIELGVQPGPQIGEALNILRSNYRNGHWETKEEGLELAKTYLSRVELLPK